MEFQTSKSDIVYENPQKNLISVGTKSFFKYLFPRFEIDFTNRVNSDGVLLSFLHENHRGAQLLAPWVKMLDLMTSTR